MERTEGFISPSAPFERKISLYDIDYITSAANFFNDIIWNVSIQFMLSKADLLMVYLGFIFSYLRYEKNNAQPEEETLILSIRFFILMRFGSNAGLCDVSLWYF